MRIWKFEIKVTDRQIVPMPAGAKLLDVQMQRGVCCIWAMCEPRAPSEPRHIAIYGTGEPVPDEPGEYVATFQMVDEALVFHVFELMGSNA